MMATYARVRGLRRLIIPVPVLTPRLSAHWINLVTPVPAGVVFPLVEGLKNEVICRDKRILDLVPIPLTPMDAAICTALARRLRARGRSRPTSPVSWTASRFRRASPPRP